MRTIRKIVALITVTAIIISAAGCTKNNTQSYTEEEWYQKEFNLKPTQEEISGKGNTENKGSVINLMEGISPQKAEAAEKISVNEYGPELNDFALRLFNTCRKNDGNSENTLISPLSVLLALSMTANGADGETLTQMEKALGISKERLNQYAAAYMSLVSKRSADFGKLELANSIWFTSDQRFTVEQSFLQTNSNYYHADIYKAPFDDSTLKAINDWVNEKTEGMIPSILDEIPAEAVMYLVNALAFDAQWAEPYFDYQVRDDTFTTAEGKEETVSYLYGVENNYISDDKASGFIKYYKGYHYAFAALLPDEGVDIDTYLETLNGAHLTEMLENMEYCDVYTRMPKFETAYNVEMSDQLKQMGMTLPFDKEKADFSKLGKSETGNISINRVIHKTFIAVDENGTKAGAATIVEMTDGGAAFIEEPKEVYLTRPFVYMLIDRETNSPFFIGVMRDLEK
ncbi:MAG: serpin family protein [Lachnospiraceae bacterium]|nr:serpin family protein [Lachnospiraceae bacterium]